MDKPNLPGPTQKIRFRGEHAAGAVCTEMIRRSASFILEPHPDDEWEFTVKAEGHAYPLYMMFNSAACGPPY